MRASMATSRRKPVPSLLTNSRLPLIFLVLLAATSMQSATVARAQDRSFTVAVLDFGESSFAQLVTEKFAATLKQEAGLTMLDRDQARAAARGAGYTGSLNLSLSEARDLGAVLGAEFFLVGDAQTLRRSPSTGPLYFESYASVFLVSSRSGRLVRWERPSFTGPDARRAEQSLMNGLANREQAHKFYEAIRQTYEDERMQRQLPVDRETAVIQEAPEDDKAAEAEGLRLPRPYRRLRPAYTESAAAAEVEATVDVLADLDASGEVMNATVARWAGFGLDESTVETVKRLHFFPAMQNGAAIPIRVLLRYNFRKPPK